MHSLDLSAQGLLHPDHPLCLEDASGLRVEDSLRQLAAFYATLARGAVKIAVRPHSFTAVCSPLCPGCLGIVQLLRGCGCPEGQLLRE